MTLYIKQSPNGYMYFESQLELHGAGWLCVADDIVDRVKSLLPWIVPTVVEGVVVDAIRTEPQSPEPGEVDVLGRVAELEQLVADLASLQLGV